MEEPFDKRLKSLKSNSYRERSEPIHERMVINCCLNTDCWIKYIDLIDYRDEFGRSKDLQKLYLFEQTPDDICLTELQLSEDGADAQKLWNPGDVLPKTVILNIKLKESSFDSENFQPRFGSQNVEVNVQKAVTSITEDGFVRLEADIQKAAEDSSPLAYLLNWTWIGHQTKLYLRYKLIRRVYFSITQRYYQIMSQANLCRLCVNICNDYKSLYDDDRQRNEVYEITVKYFHPMFLNVEQGSPLTVVCLQCWNHISDFYNFQKYVIVAQTKLLEDEKQVEVVADPTSEICNSIPDMVNVSETCQPLTEITNSHRERFNHASGIFSGANADVQDADDSISLPDLELMEDVYPDIHIISDEDLPSTVDELDVKPNSKILVKTEDISKKSKYLSHSTELSSDVISFSSSDDTDSDDFEEPVGVFIGGDFNYADNKTNTFSGEQQRISVQDCSNDEVPTKSAAETNESGINEKNYIQKTEPSNTEIVENSNNVLNTNEFCAGITSTDIITQDNGIIPMHCDTIQSKNEQSIGKSSHEPGDIITQWRPSLTCRLCTESCSSFELLQEHFHKEHSNEECYIECCQCKLNSRLQIEEHIRQHNDTVTTAQIKSKKRTSKELDDIIAQWKPNLECVECNASCASFTLLQEHYRQHHSERPCYIECCKEKLNQRHLIEEHIQYHMDPNMFKCTLCKKCHTSRLQLYSHMVHGHPKCEGDISQDEGNVSTNNDPDYDDKWRAPKNKRKRRTLNERKRSTSLADSENNQHQWESNLECVVCHKLHSNFTLLQEHFRQEHPSEECQILSCRFKLTRQHTIEEDTGLQNQTQTDTSNNTITTARSRKSCKELDAFIAHYEPNLACVLCKETCLSFTSLKLHFSQKHPNDECYIVCCQRKFTLRCTLAEHISLHIDSNTFKCDICEKCHAGKSQLVCHMQQQHMNSKQDDDDQKAQMAERKSVVRTTYQEIDDFIAQCRPTLQCALCQEQRSNFMLLHNHFIEEHGNQACHILCCDRKLQTRHEIEDHLLLHNDPNAFKCALCGQCCTSRVSMYNHKRSQHPFATNSGVNVSCTNGRLYDKARKTGKNKLMRKERLINKRLDKTIAQWMTHLECTVCNEACSSFTLLENHFRQRHPNEEIYVVCCQQKWKQRSHIVDHIRLRHEHGMLKKGNGKTRRKRQELDEFISQYERDLECVECSKTCPNFTALKRHFRLEHPTKDCYIVCCEHKLTGRSQIVEHIRLHVDPNAFKCELCDHSCNGVASLRSHMHYRHGKSRGHITEIDNQKSITPVDKSKADDDLDASIAQWRSDLECVICSESCSSFLLLREHFRLRHPYEECHLVCCQRKLKSRQQIGEHIRFHTDPNAFKCSKCNKLHMNSSNLRAHMRYRHTFDGEGDPDSNRARRKSTNKPNGRKTFKEFDDIIAQWKPNLECVLCPETCSSFTLLRKHFTQSHPHQKCHIICCGRKFDTRYQIEEHVRLHINPDAFKCDMCGKCHTNRALLYNHIVTNHPERRDTRFANVGYGKFVPKVKTDEEIDKTGA